MSCSPEVTVEDNDNVDDHERLENCWQRTQLLVEVLADTGLLRDDDINGDGENPNIAGAAASTVETTITAMAIAVIGKNRCRRCRVRCCCELCVLNGGNVGIG